MIITNIIKLLNSQDFYGGGEFIEIAKGKNATVKNIRKFKEQIKRNYKIFFK
jgi:hypothetical protein